MDVMVADTSVLIDLERGSLLEQSFALPFRFKVPDLLYRNELLNRRQGPAFGERLVRLGLEVVELNGDEVSRAVLFGREYRGLSLPDSFALALAAGRKWTLLTGDAALRALAQCLRVTCHGVLWVLDRIHQEGVASPEELVSGLTRIRDHPRCRLPGDEIDIRLRHYAEHCE
ncbi:MAG: hypothetical protein OXI33_01990 [Chloroflexota bacterium]|nr:hypothetical protein [Chloroflexota bacterium]